MSITVEAVYEQGVLRIHEPLALQEGTAVRIVVTPLADGVVDPLASVIGICQSSEGIPLSTSHDSILYGTSRPTP